MVIWFDKPNSVPRGSITGKVASACPEPDGIKKLMTDWEIAILTAARCKGKPSKRLARLYEIVSPILPISINTLMVVANPTIKAPGAAKLTALRRVSLMVVALIFEAKPEQSAIIKKTADSHCNPRTRN